MEHRKRIWSHGSIPHSIIQKEQSQLDGIFHPMTLLMQKIIFINVLC